MSPGSFWAFTTFSHHWGHFYIETSEKALLFGQAVWAYEILFQKFFTCLTEPEFGVRSQARRQDMVLFESNIVLMHIHSFRNVAGLL